MAYSANVERLRPSATIAVSTLAKRLRAEGRDIIDLSAGEPDFDTPAFIADAAVDGIRAGKTRYTPVAGMPELRKAIAAGLSERAGREVSWESVVVSSGAKQALFNACFSLFGPGDEVLVATPYWTSYPEIVGLARAEPVFVTGSEALDFRLTPGDLDEVAGDRTRGLILSTPSNPTGSVYSLDEFAAVAAWARSRGIWLIADEIYRQIYFGEGGEAPGLLDLPPDVLGPHVLIDGASKSFAMTGWRLGFSVTDPDLARKMTALQSHVTSNAATPSQVAALAAYTRVDSTRSAVTEMREAFRRRRDLVVGLFDELLPEFDYVKPEGAFYLYFRVDSLFGETMDGATAFCSSLLEETGVAMVPGAAFGDDRWVRMSYATSDHLLNEAISRMAAALFAR
ncbi:MAG TPA: pyridoxal phosphate-dependent aminotransferase [Longimicrobiales bacterium]|jgi:aspartate aminotransferase